MSLSEESKFRKGFDVPGTVEVPLIDCCDASRLIIALDWYCLGMDV